MPKFFSSRALEGFIYEPLFLPGNFSGVRAEFTFERSCSYFLIEMYGMSVVLVAISWMGFLVPLDQTAARIALGITSVLTEVAILNIMNNAMPKVCDHLKESNTIIFSIAYTLIWFPEMTLYNVQSSSGATNLS